MNWIRQDGHVAPYTHEPGVLFPVLGTSFTVQIFPAMLRLLRAEEGKWKVFSEMALSIQGPLEGFTVQLDPYSRQLVVFGKSAHGWLRYLLYEGQLFLKKAPLQQMLFIVDGKEVPKQEGEAFCWTERVYDAHPLERLSLGGHKAQDLRMWKQKLDPTLVWPTWFALGQENEGRAEDEDTSLGEMGCLLEEWHQAILGGHPEKIVPAWRRFFLAAFSDCLIPRFMDTDYLGIVGHSSPPKGSPWELLRRGTLLLRQLFVQEEGDSLFFLPHLPPECHSGRMHLSLRGVSSSVRCDLEWTKKRIRRLFFFSPETQEFALHFKDSKRFRVRHRIGDKGYFLETGAKILLQGGQSVLLDRFEK